MMALLQRSPGVGASAPEGNTVHLVAILRRLLALPAFRRLFAMRVLTQAADGTLQVGMASYILFSPQSQPDAWAIVTVLAITLLPFSLLGPFVSILLDHWSRRQSAVVVDLIRAGIGVAIAVIVATGHRTTASQTALYLLLLVALSLNRFLLAGLSAGMHHTVPRSEYLNASAVMPMIGPAGVMVGGGIAAAIRLIGSHYMPTYRADAIIFCDASVIWVASALVALGFGRNALGPDRTDRPIAPGQSVSEVARGMVAAFGHLRRRPPALLGLVMIACQRFGFGLLSVAVMLMYRNYFHGQAQVNSALLSFGAWGAATGLGFVLSAALVPPMTRWVGMSATATLLLIATAVVQSAPGSILRPWALVISGFFIGWFAQSFKICVDTLVQAHVDEDLKGRVFALYDGIFNAAIVVAAVFGALVLPVTGASHPVFWGMSAGYAVLALVFFLGSRRIGTHRFNEGTELGV